MNEFMAIFIRLLFFVLWGAILGRVIISWINLSPNNPIALVLYQITEPILGPIRRILPQTGMLDLSPTVALIAMWIIYEVLNRTLL